VTRPPATPRARKRPARTPVVAAVEADIKALKVPSGMAGIAAVARKLAAVLDEDGVPATARVTAARQLLDALGELRAPAAPAPADAGKEAGDGIEQLAARRVDRVARRAVS
jgi:hypothetical protein